MPQPRPLSTGKPATAPPHTPGEAAPTEATAATPATASTLPAHARTWGFAIGDAGAIGLILGWKLATLVVALIAVGLLDPAYAFPGEYDFTFAGAFERLESALRLN